MLFKENIAVLIAIFYLSPFFSAYLFERLFRTSEQREYKTPENVHLGSLFKRFVLSLYRNSRDFL